MSPPPPFFQRPFLPSPSTFLPISYSTSPPLWYTWTWHGPLTYLPPPSFRCTDATSVDVEEALYARAAAYGITLVTISQRPALVQFHGTELRLLDGAGDWEHRKIVPAPAESPPRPPSRPNGKAA